MTVVARERALVSVSGADSPLHVRLEVAITGLRLTMRLARMTRVGKLSLLELGDQGVEGQLQHARDVARRDLVTEQLLSTGELFVERLVRREAHLDPIHRDRCDRMAHTRVFRDTLITRNG